MTNRSSFEDLIKFIDYLSDKGLLKQQTAASRKAVANKVFENLDDADRADVLALDIDDAMNRFINKAGSNYSPGSLQTYKARLKSTLDDFAAYLKNPMGFRPTIATRAARKPKSVESVASTSQESASSSKASQPEVSARGISSLPSADIFPIPLRPDLVLRIQGLPHDLTNAEANKISAVVKAFVTEE
ncbi:hypothetical protein [uncultured Tateyamaria sp.]|uniref:hypothetical protein n=1 Tax=uncultured Tateyamaria sp. TaxID=455651 RepID=UPI002601CB55|nr:hypothetical protein [uncultured Tateyamaria sp.]